MVNPPNEAIGVEVIRLRVPPPTLGLAIVDDPGLEGVDSLGARNSGRSGVSSIVNRPLAYFFFKYIQSFYEKVLPPNYLDLTMTQLEKKK